MLSNAYFVAKLWRALLESLARSCAANGEASVGIQTKTFLLGFSIKNGKTTEKNPRKRVWT